jgi:uncharacterized protein
MSGRCPDEHVAVHVMEQEWRQVAFLHWRVDADDIAALLPDGLVPDLVDGSAWLCITPFCVTRVGFAPVSRWSVLPAFPETNLRTYVRDRADRDGLWFLSIEATSMTTVLGGRALGAPYHRARATVTDIGTPGSTVVQYRSDRRGSAGIGHDITVEVGDALRPDDLVDQLTGRWRAFTRAGIGRVATIIEVAVEHEPWPLRTAAVPNLRETLITAAGLPAPLDAPIVHWSDGVTARFAAPRPVSR